MDSNEIPPPPPPPRAPGSPPVMYPAAPAPRPRRGRGWMVFALILLALLIVSLVTNFSQFISGAVSGRSVGRTRIAGPRLEEAMLEDNDAVDKIAVIDVGGIITSRAIDQSGYSMVDVIRSQLDRAKEDSKVKAVVLRVDSPGGEVLASDEIYRAISDFQDKSGKPVITSMGDLAASGGYYISSASRWIVANEMTLTGSIGVILHSWNYRSLMDKIGLAPEVYKSGKFKDMLSGERSPGEIPAEEHAMVQALIDETYNRFKDVVEKGRDRAHKLNKDQGKELAGRWKEYADGRVLSGTQAFDLGFVDQLGNFKDAVEKAKKIGGVTDGANLVQYPQRVDLSDILRIFGKTETPALKVDVGMDLPKLEAGRPYYLSPTLIH